MQIGKTLFLLWLAHFCMDFFIGIWPIYKTIAQIDIAKAGLIIGLSGFIGEVLQLFFGYFSDRGYRKKILITGLLCASSILSITFTSQILPCFAILTIMMIGSGAFHPSATGIASTLSIAHRSKLMLIFASGGTLGLGLSQLTFMKLMDLFQGQAIILFIPFVILILCLIFHAFPKQEILPARYSFKQFFAPLLPYKKPLVLLYLAQVATQALTMGIYFLLPDVLMTRDCHSWICLGGGHLCFVAGSALMMLPAGYLCDRFGQKLVLQTVVSLAICLFYFFLSSSNLSFIGTISLLTSLGAFIGLINPIIVTWGNRLVPESPSTVSALLMGCAWCVGNLGPAIMGGVSQLFTENPYTKTLFLAGALFVFILICISYIPRVEKEATHGGI
jgi:MFS transporter, FSR family, fosmidomycin resistance protein